MKTHVELMKGAPVARKYPCYMVITWEDCWECAGAEFQLARFPLDSFGICKRHAYETFRQLDKTEFAGCKSWRSLSHSTIFYSVEGKRNSARSRALSMAPHSNACILFPHVCHNWLVAMYGAT